MLLTLLIYTDKITNFQVTYFQSKIANFQIISWGDFLGLSSEIYLCVSILVGFILIALANFKPIPSSLEQKKNITLLLCSFVEITFILSILILFVQLCILGIKSQILFNGYAIIDLYSLSVKICINLTIFFILRLSKSYIKAHPRHLMEYSVLFLLLAFFLIVLVSAYNLLTAFLAIIGFSLTLYILLLYDSFNHSSREAGIKYFYLSTFSSGLLISGIFFSYFIFHNTNFLFITWQLHNWVWFNNFPAKIMLFQFMVYFITFGFLFKLAAFPCHLWAPEIYDGSPHPITALFVLPIKIATLSFFLRLLNYTFADLYQSWSFIIWFSSLFSMIWGCIGALNESRIKRFVAYSSINQMGFLFIGLVCGTFESLRATVIYLFIYVIMNLGFFIILLTTKEQFTHRALTYLTDLNDYAQKNYFYTATLVIILFSMAGIPPLGGFFGKYYLFLHSFEIGHFSLVVVGMVTSVIATYYYLRIIKIMWFERPIINRFVFKTILTGDIFNLYVGVEFILILFLIWSPWMFIWSNNIVSVGINPLTGI
jgi:NADH-quinone oxidoreductase subunit N